MRTAINIDQWNRREHYLFFKQFEEPFFGITVLVDCTQAYSKSKEKGWSFFLYYLYQSLRAANAVEAFRYRISEDAVWCYDQVHGSSTINRPDGTFGFSYISFYEDAETFYAGAKREIERVQNSSGLKPAISGENVIHVSPIPWIDFTSLSHARSFSFPDSCPKISFGKMTEKEGIRTMPVSIHVHHALMDGLQVSQWIDLFQQYLNE